MAENTIAKAYVQLIPSFQGVQKNIESSLNGANVGANFGGQFVSKLKGIIATAGIGKMFQMAISQGAELEQNLGGTEVVFGNFSNSIQKSAQDAYKNMGLSASEYMSTANKMGSLFQGSGLSQVKSLELTSQAMQRAADVASIMGLDTKVAMESIAGAAKGNFTMMDNLGVAMNATTLKAYALEKGINFNWNMATNAEKTELAMKMFMDRTSQYAGNFAKESEDTISGSFGAMKASFHNFFGDLSLGREIQPSLQALMSTSVTFLTKNIFPAVGNIIKGLPKAIIFVIQNQGPQLMRSGLNLMQNIASGLPKGIPELLSQIVPMITSFSENIRLYSGLLIDTGLDFIQNLVKGIMNSLPILIENVPIIISNFSNAINDKMPNILMTGWNILITLIEGLISAIPTLIANIGPILTAIWDTFISYNWWNLALNILSLLGSGIISATSVLVDGFFIVLDTAINFVKNMNWLELGQNIINGVINGIKSLAGALWDALVGAVRSAWNGVLSFLGIASPSKEGIKVGQFIDEGISIGLNKGKNNLAATALNVAKESIKPFDTKMLYDYSIDALSLNNKENQSTSGFNQTVIVNAPTELSPYEIARQNRIATQQLALNLALNRG